MTTADRPVTAEEIASGARTVQHLYDYLCELRKNASELEETIAPVDRGYFVADEDDATRGLMVSYWQTRNALLELVNSFRERVGSISHAQPAEFLVPYAAALVLVDTARFVRGLAENRPVVRRKLNEPATEFGVPGGTYDTIQKSLVSSRNAWHLSRATRYFDVHRDELQSFAEQNDLATLFEITVRLRDCVDVSKTQYAKAKVATRFDQCLRWLGRSMIMQSTYSVQKLTAGMMADVFVKRGHVPAIPATIANELSDVLQPGDVIAVRKEYAVTNYFLPGYWPHVAMVIGDEIVLQEYQNTCAGDGDSKTCQQDATLCWQSVLANGSKLCVIESMKDGVHVRSVSSPLGSDSFVILRPQLQRAEILQAIGRGLRHVGKPYDFNFDFRRSDRLVCTEVVYRSFEGVGPIRFPLVERMGRPTLSGLDLIEMALRRNHFAPVALYVPDESPILQLHDEIDDVIRRKSER
ncbi:MAG: hypothetical protein KDB27_06615 [Planctomycetales bacterium]|nr:hypothetical protein [Planctomycetales bacterium]